MQSVQQRILVGLLVGLAAIGMTGCYPGGVESYEETDLVLTMRNPEAAFPGNQTFAMPKTVPELCGQDEECEEDTYNHDLLDPIILDAIRRNMTQAEAGYTEVANPEDADLYVSVGAVVSTNFFVYYYYDYWGWWGYYPGYGGGWWTWYPVQAIGVYKAGTIIFSLIKPDEIEGIEDEQAEDGKDPAPHEDGEQRVRALWSATINGLAGSGTGASRINRAIDQAFSQSPYVTGAQ